LIDKPTRQCLRQAAYVSAAHHIHVDARLQRERRSLDEIAGYAMLDQFGNRRVVADDDPLKAEFALKIRAGDRHAPSWERRRRY